MRVEQQAVDDLFLVHLHVPGVCITQDCHWWHSGIRPGSVDEVALATLCHARHVQFNAPLFETDCSLQLVARSHLRGTTVLEREAAAAAQVCLPPFAKFRSTLSLVAFVGHGGARSY